MTKAEYMEQLQKKLDRFGRELKEEIMEDYRQHFAEGQKQGKSDEEIIRELGNIEEMIRELDEADKENAREGNDPGQAESGFHQYAWPYRAVELECDAADIELERSADGQVSIWYEIPGSDTINRRLVFYQREEGDVLYAGIKENKQKTKGILESIRINKEWFRLGNPVLKVKLPEGLERLSFSTSSGDVCAQGISVDTFSGNTASGDVTMKEASAKQIQLKVASGDLELTGIRAVGLKVNSASGHIEIEDAKTETAQVSTASGDIEIEDAKAQTAQISTASGDVDLKGISADDLSVESASGDIAACAEVKKCHCGAVRGDIDLKATGPAEQISVNAVRGDIYLTLEGAGGMKAEVAAHYGTAHISWAGECKKVSAGTYTFGDGSCRVEASTRSGNLEISG